MKAGSYENIKIILQGRIFWYFVLFLSSLILAFFAYKHNNPPINSRTKNILRALRMMAFFFLFLSIFDPVVSGVRRYREKPIIPVLIDNSRSIKVSDKVTPEDKIRAFLNGDALKWLQKDADIRIIPFSSGLESLSTKLNFESDGTAIGNAIAELITRIEPENISALILISDGDNNIGEDPVQIAQGIDFPIYTIGVGTSIKRKDIFIKDIITTDIAYKDKEFPLRVVIGGFGYEGVKKNVILYEDGKKVGTKEFVVGGKGELVDVEFNVKPERIGEIRYRVYIPEEADELSPLNNSRTTFVRVQKSKMKFLAVVDILNFDYTFFKRAVLSNPNWEIDEVIVGKEKTTNEEKLPRSADELLKYDCVLVFGSPNALGQRWGYVKEYVQKGGSFLYFALDDLKNASTELKALLPFELGAGDGELKSDNFSPNLSLDAVYHPIAKIDDGTGRSVDRIISSMPPLEKVIFVGRLKNGAIPIFVHPSIAGLPILTIWRLGAGKIATITAFPFWKWGFLASGFGEENKAYRSFVGNIMQWLITKELEERFTATTDKKIYKAGEPILIKASLKDESGNPITLAYIDVSVRKMRGDSLMLTQPASEEGAGFYKLIIPSLPADSYKVELKAKLGEKEIGRAKTNFIVEEYSVEFERPGLNEPLLRDIATTTGGRFLYLANADSIKDIIKVKDVSRAVEFEKSVWNSPIFFTLFLLCLSTEWFIRKRADLL